MEMAEMYVVSDLSQLDELTEANILKVLKARYERDLIYTRVQDILIAINPRKRLPLYDTQVHNSYAWDNFDTKDPHVFEVAASAYRRLKETDTNQVIIVSGESGAGKTESTKHMVRHIVHMCQEGDMALHDKIVEINPLLESFGNAKTTMNSNSSRFAKYLELGFSQNGQLAGAVVRDYMLEKSRVVHQTPGEGNFHAFYALFHGCPRQKREDLFLNQMPGEYRITRSDFESLDMETFYIDMYNRNMEILKKINVDTEVVHTMMAGVINITEVDFVESDDGFAKITDVAPYVHAAILLDIDEEKFGHALISSIKVFHGEDVVTYKSVKEARDSRDALAKTLYERMFGWLVRQINTELHPKNYGSNLTHIGILDIAGFEKLRHNSFEQLLINLVNEKLQNVMNDTLFNIEMGIYKEDGIELEGIHFENNDTTLELLEVKHGGILYVLDDVSNFKQSSDESFVMEVKKKFSNHPRFLQPKGDLPHFSINHFAALVTYDGNGFIEKNMDRLNVELMECMKESKDEFISDLFTVKRGPTGTISETKFNYRKSHRTPAHVRSPGGRTTLTPTQLQKASDLSKSLKQKFGEKLKPPTKDMFQKSPKAEHKTLTKYFTNSLMDLLSKLLSADPYYVRCLKANSRQAPNDFEDPVVGDQLRYNGLAEIAKIRKMGFSVRQTHADFYKRSKWMLSKPSGDKKSQIQAILLHTPPALHREFRVGKTKVFMKEEVDHFIALATQIRMQSAAKTISSFIRRVGAENRRRKEEEERRRREEEERKREEVEQRKKEEAERMKKEEDEESQAETENIFEENKTGVNPDTLRTSTVHFGVSQSGGFLRNRFGASSSSGQFDYSKTCANGHNFYEIEIEISGEKLKKTGSCAENFYDRGSPSMSSSQATISTTRSESPMSSQTDSFNEKQDEEDDEENEKNQNVENEETAKSFEFWDVCQMVSREIKTKDVYERRSLQVIKVITYMFLFCLLLWCAVSQKISLMIIASFQYDRAANRTENDYEEDRLIAVGRHFLIGLAIVIPYVLIFVSSIFKWLFGNLPMPQLSTILGCLFVETCHTAGLCALCFHILPELDMARGIMLMSCVSFFPSVLLPVCTSNTKYAQKVSKGHQLGVFALDMLAILVIGGYIVIMIIYDKPKHFFEEGTMYSETSDIIIFVLAMICISLQWWENFVDDRFCGPTKRRSGWKMFILGVKFNLQESRAVISFFTSFWKICLTTLLAWLYVELLPLNDRAQINGHNRGLKDVDIGMALEKLGDMPIEMNSAILTLTLASFVGNYAGSTACKLQMQFFSFSLPLMLSVPVSVVIVALDCHLGGVLSPFTDETRACFGDTENDNLIWVHYVLGAAVWMALYWICRHIFFPTTERLAKSERLFMYPYYCGILFEQNFILGRKRHNRKVHKDFERNQFTFRLSEVDSRINENGEEIDNSDNNTEDVESDKYRSPKFRTVPMIYACATMWHENKQEMLQIMKSLFRMDRDQYLRRTAELLSGKEDEDFYDFEAHIMFDDAMELNDDEEFEPNQFVKLMMSIIDDAASSVYQKTMRIKPPFKVPTPYGGQLIFTLPGENFLFVHLKDKNKIRHRKRWSQVMYMYYLLGYRIVRLCQEKVSEHVQRGDLSELLGWHERQNLSVGNIGRSHIFHVFDDQVIQKASNTYLLALDGDVDFTPGAVRLLLDRMRKSDKVGAACGRIHPIGTGPVVWFQKFEYAIAHWLQKATEHVLGCVLCSPGCFSLFRGSALMDDNVMRKYTIVPTEPSHHLMYDQGEDRWLCTLLLQQGYRVDYVAASDAYTYAPEGFAEFFNQRRRWMPSTVANIIDLLADYKNTVYVNSNISMLYIFYQASLLLSTIVGPATVLMMIAGANLIVFKVNLWYAYLIALAPAAFYFILCFYVKTKVQIMFAEILTGFYAFIMMIVLVGTIVTAAQESPFHPSVIFIAFLVILFAGSALLHPEEWTCVIFGVLYFLLIPTGFLLLIFYSLCNLHVVSWGTREVPKKKTQEEIEEEKKKAENKKKKKEQGFFARFFPQAPMKDLKDILAKMTDLQGKNKSSDDSEQTKLLSRISEGIEKLVEQKHGPGVKEVRIEMEDRQNSEPTLAVSVEPSPTPTVLKGILKKSKEGPEPDILPVPVKPKRDELVNPAWIECKDLKKGSVVPMVTEELRFWKGFVAKYLAPLSLTDEEKKNTQKGLIELRNNVCLGMAMINLLWIAINFMFQLSSPTKIKLKISSDIASSDNIEDLEENQDDDDEPADNIVSVDVLGMLFIFFFLIILLLQCVGMIAHRWGTFLHLVSVTQLRNPFQKFMNKEMGDSVGMADLKPKDAMQIVEKLITDPDPDYTDDEEEGELSEAQDAAKQELINLQTKGTRFVGPNNQIGTSTRQLDQSKFGEDRRRTLQKSLATMVDGFRATGGKFVHAPQEEELHRRLQDQIRKTRDPSYKDRALPPIKKKNRLNLGAGRAELEKRVSHHIQTTHRGPLIPEFDDEDIYDVIKPKGTLGRQIGKKLQAVMKTDTSNLDKTVIYQGRNHYRHTDYGQRGNDSRGYRRSNGGACIVDGSFVNIV